MSQYPYQPSPYQPPTVNYSGGPMMPFSELQACKSAGVWLSIFGGLMVLFGFCIGSFVWIVPLDTISSQLQQQMQQEGANFPMLPGWTFAEAIRFLFTAVGSMSFVAGGLLLAMAIFVRRGGRASAVIAQVIIGLIAGYMLLNLVGGLLQSGGNILMMLFELVISGGVLALCLVTIYKLVLALRSTKNIASMQSMQQMQYWMMMQQQQAAQGGYGYGMPGYGGAGYGLGYGQMPGGQPQGGPMPGGQNMGGQNMGGQSYPGQNLPPMPPPPGDAGSPPIA